VILLRLNVYLTNHPWYQAFINQQLLQITHFHILLNAVQWIKQSH
jgi:predicted metal-dependent phosphoesterase TrpH